MGHRSWEQYGEQVESSPAGALKVAVLGLLALMVVGMFFGVIGWFVWWPQQAAQVIQEEFGPREALTKYEWFKDASAALDGKRATLLVYETRFAALGEQYGKTPRGQWAREDREQWNLWTAEVAGIRASYNTLAADYNAQMAKFNWRFANRGMLPAGASDPLPRDYKPYDGGVQ